MDDEGTVLGGRAQRDRVSFVLRPRDGERVLHAPVDHRVPEREAVAPSQNENTVHRLEATVHADGAT